MSAVDTLLFIYLANAVLVVGDGSDRAYLFTGSFEMNDCAVRASLSTHTAFLTLGRIDMHSYFTG